MQFLIFALIAVAAVAAQSPDASAPILKQSSDVGVNNYQWSYETGNGISAQEQGELKNAGNKDAEALSAQGSAQWTAPDGTAIKFSYLADENGYQPQGDHLPVAPAIPDYILRSIEYNKAHPEQES